MAKGPFDPAVYRPVHGVCAAEASNNPITGVSKPGNILCILSFSGFGQLFGAAGR